MIRKVPYDINEIMSMWYSNFKSGRRCPICQKTASPTIDYIKSTFVKVNYRLLSKKYIHCDSHLNYICDKGHKNKNDLE